MLSLVTEWIQLTKEYDSNKLYLMKSLLYSVLFSLTFVSFSFALDINDIAPSFSLRDNNGKNFYLSDYIGAKKKEPVKGVIINFFASYCKPCKNELPVINRLIDEFRAKGIEVVIIGYSEDFDKIEEMLTPLKINKPIILSDKYGKVGEKYGVRGLPMTVFIGSDGRIKDFIRGELPDIEKVMLEKAGKLLK